LPAAARRAARSTRSPSRRAVSTTSTACRPAGGTDSHTRLTLDSNQAITDTIALRANLLYSYEEVPDRDPADRERQGVALSALFTPSEALKVLVDYYGLDAEDKPDLGGYLLNRKPARNVPVYAQRQDFLESDVDTFTARISYDFAPDLYLHNATRYGTTDNGYVTTGARGASTGVNNPGGVHATTTLSTHQGWQEVDYLVNQTNLFANLDLGGRTHEFILGIELSDHEVVNGIYNVANSGQNCITGTGKVLNAWCIRDASGQVVAGIDRLMNRRISTGPWDQDWQARTISTYLMDTVDLRKTSPCSRACATTTPRSTCARRTPSSRRSPATTTPPTASGTATPASPGSSARMPTST
jgi:catecholate siderophore receptor